MSKTKLQLLEILELAKVSRLTTVEQIETLQDYIDLDNPKTAKKSCSSLWSQ